MALQTSTPLPTTVIGSHAYPGWMWTALDEVEKGNYGITDHQELNGGLPVDQLPGGGWAPGGRGVGDAHAATLPRRVQLCNARRRAACELAGRAAGPGRLAFAG